MMPGERVAAYVKRLAQNDPEKLARIAMRFEDGRRETAAVWEAQLKIAEIARRNRDRAQKHITLEHVAAALPHIDWRLFLAVQRDGENDAQFAALLAAASTQRNAGPGPLTFIYAAVNSYVPPAPPGDTMQPQGGEILGFMDASQWASLAGGAVAFTLDRATVAAEASLPPLAGPGWRLVGASGASFGSPGVLNGPLVNDGSAPLAVSVLTLAPVGPAGTPIAGTPVR